MSHLEVVSHPSLFFKELHLCLCVHFRTDKGSQYVGGIGAYRRQSGAPGLERETEGSGQGEGKLQTGVSESSSVTVLPLCNSRGHKTNWIDLYIVIVLSIFAPFLTQTTVGYWEAGDFLATPRECHRSYLLGKKNMHDLQFTFYNSELSSDASHIIDHFTR